MHFEVLVEDRSGKKMLDILLPRLIGEGHTFRVIAHGGVGRIPRDLRDPKELSKRTLLNKLPGMLRAYGKIYRLPPAGEGASPDPAAAVILVCDLDDRCRKAFREEVLRILDQCDPRPEARLCFAVEEGEAWFLGDPDAIMKAYPRAKGAVLASYENDSVCGTWEKLADAIFPGGRQALKRKEWPAIGAEKFRWAEAIAPHMDADRNTSPSFRHFRDKVRELIGSSEEVRAPIPGTAEE
jgi:hypothetical protein